MIKKIALIPLFAAFAGCSALHQPGWGGLEEAHNNDDSKVTLLDANEDYIVTLYLEPNLDETSNNFWHESGAVVIANGNAKGGMVVKSASSVADCVIEGHGLVDFLDAKHRNKTQQRSGIVDIASKPDRVVECYENVGEGKSLRRFRLKIPLKKLSA